MYVYTYVCMYVCRYAGFKRSSVHSQVTPPGGGVTPSMSTCPHSNLMFAHSTSTSAHPNQGCHHSSSNFVAPQSIPLSPLPALHALFLFLDNPATLLHTPVWIQQPSVFRSCIPTRPLLSPGISFLAPHTMFVRPCRSLQDPHGVFVRRLQ